MRRTALVLAVLVVPTATLVLAAAATSHETVAQSPAKEGPLQAKAPQVASVLADAAALRLALRLEDAHARVDEAAALAERLADRMGFALALQTKGQIHKWASQPEDAETAYRRARAEFEAIGSQRGVASTLMGLTALLLERGERSRADEAGAEAIKILGDLGDEANGATVQLNLIRGDSASPDDRRRIDEVLAVADRLKDDDLRAYALRSLGGLQFNAGDFVGAQATLEEAVRLSRQLGDVANQAAIHVMIGRIRRAHNDWDGALREYGLAVDILAPTGERYMLVQAINSTAVALQQLGRQAESLAAIERGLALARDSRNPVLIDFMLGNLGGGLLQKEDWTGAVKVFEEVFSRKPSAYIASFRHDQLAIALNRLGRSAEALDHSTTSVLLTRDLGLTDYLESRLAFRVSLLAALGRLDEALADARDILTVIDGLRRKLLPTDFLKRGFAGRVEPAYARVVDLLTKQGRTTEAFDASEQSRARAFLDLLAAREAPRDAIATRGPEPAASRATGALPSSSLALPLAADAIGAIAARLGTTIVTYWVGESATIAWIVGPNGQPVSVTLPIARGRLTELVAATTALLRKESPRSATPASKTPGADSAKTPAGAVSVPLRGLGLLSLAKDDRSAWRELCKTLIDPLRTHLPRAGSRLTIVPHGPLFQLAFAALPSADGRYLIEDYDLHYAPAASVLDFTGRRQQTVRAGPRGPWMLVGNPSSLPDVDGRRLAPLPGAARELSAIAALAPGGRVTRLEATGANEAALGLALDVSHPSVLHFATHGLVSDDPTTAPFLVMNRRSDDPAEDGRLTLDEIYGLSLSSDLVALSACRTGLGPVSSDGIVGLSRGFFHAGTPSILATHWDVPDVTTAVLMPRFYRDYAVAGKKSSSLRAAQVALIADLRAGRIVVTASGRRVTLPEHPLLWAGFFLSGEP